MSDRPTIQSGQVGNEPSCALIVTESEITLLRRLVSHYSVALAVAGTKPTPGSVVSELEVMLRRAEQLTS
jgi:hypothetical protein